MILESCKFNSKKRNKKAILSVGRLEEQKNYKFLIDEVKNTNFSIEIIGDGSLEETLMSYAKENGVDLKILSKKNYLGLLEKYNDYQYFVLPSFYEGNPKVLIEAMSKGCIVLASNISNHTEIIKNNNNGIIFDLNKGSSINHLWRHHSSFQISHLLGHGTDMFWSLFGSLWSCVYSS